MSKSLRRAVSVPALIASSRAWSAATIAAAEAQTFSITIKAVGNDETLKLSDGSMTKAPIAPGVYAVINGGALFTPRQPAGPTGLEALAEDGNPEPLLGSLKNKEEVRTIGIFVPGQPFSVSVKPGDRLYFASMFVQSNDKFYAPAVEGIDLLNAVKASREADLTGMVMLWDAGTEVDEPPGSGQNQAPRQAGPNAGTAENGIVGPVSDGFNYPATASYSTGLDKALNRFMIVIPPLAKKESRHAVGFLQRPIQPVIPAHRPHGFKA